jgi:hypothetical protein
VFFSGIALASLTPHRVPFVHLLLPGQSETSVVNDIISLMFRGDVPLTDIRLQLEQQTTSVLHLGNLDFIPPKYFSLFRLALGSYAIFVRPCKRRYQKRT